MGSEVPGFWGSEVRVLGFSVLGSIPGRRPRTGNLRTIGTIRTTLKSLSKAPKQGREGAPDAWLEVRSSFADGLTGLAVDDEIIVVTWLHKSRRDILRVRPRDNTRLPLKGVFATRSQDRPNPLGFHTVTVKRIIGTRLRIGPIEAIDGAMTRWGFPVGPVTLMDEVGLDVAVKAGGVMIAALGDRLAPAIPIDALVKAGRLGRKNGKGFYQYQDGKKSGVDEAVYGTLGVTKGAGPGEPEIVERLTMALLNEAVRALENLGYSAPAAEDAVRLALEANPGSDTAAVVRAALKHLMSKGGRA